MTTFTKIFILLFFFLQSTCLISQEADILTRSGGSVSFPINTLKKYKEGMVLNDWTVLNIKFTSTVATDTWKLEFRALSDDIYGDSSTNMDLRIISIMIYSPNELLDAYIVKKESIPLSNMYNPIILNAPQGDYADNEIYISYMVGTGDVSLMNNPPDYYNVDIEFKLSRAD